MQSECVGGQEPGRMGHFGRKSGQALTERARSLLPNSLLVDLSTFVPSCPEDPVLRRERLCGNKWNVAPTGRKSDLLNRASILT